jgi:hypothetical protein
VALRLVHQLKEAQLWKGKPPHVPRPRRRSAKAGLAYQRRIENLLRQEIQESSLLRGGQLLTSPWIRYRDEAGWGFAQPDAVVLAISGIWIFEVKLSYTPVAYAQLHGLYRPLVLAIWPAPTTFCVQVCSALTTRRGPVPPAALALEETLDQDIFSRLWLVL